jgi:hypothetical protein
LFGIGPQRQFRIMEVVDLANGEEKSSFDVDEAYDGFLSFSFYHFLLKCDEIFVSLGQCYKTFDGSN